MKKLIRLSFALLTALLLVTSCSEDDENIPLELGINTGIILDNGESKVITEEELQITDEDNDEVEIFYTVTQAPENGMLVLIDDETTSITTFTQQDITDNKLEYIHDGSFTESDYFEYSVTDGETVLTGTFVISIGEKQINHVFVLNEGNSTGSVSLIDVAGNVTNNYFKATNGIELGQYPESIAVNDEYAFIVVTTGTGAGYILVVDRATLEVEKTISGLSYPREIVLLENKAYISNGSGEGVVYIVDLKTLTMNSTSIAVGHGPEKMVVSNNKLYVANSGGWSNDDNTVSVINLNTLTVENTITVKSCPKDMVVDADGNVWVNCGGVPDYSNYPNVSYTDAGLSKINIEDNSVVSWEIANPSGTVKNIAISKDKTIIYYLADAVYAMDITATDLPTTKLIDKSFYGIDVHPVTDKLWLCESVDATTAGKVEVYLANGTKETEYSVGAMPNSSVFVY